MADNRRVIVDRARPAASRSRAKHSMSAAADSEQPQLAAEPAARLPDWKEGDQPIQVMSKIRMNLSGIVAWNDSNPYPAPNTGKPFNWTSAVPSNRTL